MSELNQKFFLLLIVFSILAGGCGSKNEHAARIISVVGQVDAKVAADKEFAGAQPEMQMMPGGAVRTAKDSSAKLLTVADSVQIDVTADSYFEVRAADKIGFQGSGKAIFDVNKQKNAIVIETQHGNTAVLGTKFGQYVSSGTFELWVEKGLVEFSSKSGEKRKVGANQKLVWKTDEALPAPVECNMIESATFFGAGGESFDFNRR